MKKTLALVLAVLVAFSMFAFATSAADSELVKVTFINDGKEYSSFELLPGTVLTPYMPENPTKAPDGSNEYIFKGWAVSEDGELYFKNTIPAVGTEDVTYMAIYSAKEIKESQTFWEFIESIFARINLLFQYFAAIFDFNN